MTLNRSLTSKFNLVKTNVGKLDDNKLTYVGYVGDCEGEECIIYDACDYNSKGKCTFEQNFLNTIYVTWLDKKDGIGDVLTQQQVHRIGASLMPLYSQLIKLAKVSFSISASQSIYEDSKGTKRAHPVFREMRDVIKSIGAEIKDAGLYQTWEAKFGKGGKTIPVQDIEDMMKKGNRTRFEDYEESLRKKESKKKEEEIQSWIER